LHFICHFMGEVNRVNMPPIEHHLVIKHLSCAYPCWWMVVVFCASK
jgi:hypothetical protein